jgi:hypothetical protein
VVSKTSKTSILQKEWSQRIPEKIRENCPATWTHESIIEWKEEKYICWGPISLINHACDALPSLQTDPDKYDTVTEVLGTILKGKRGWKVEEGEEVTIKYADEFSECACNSCKETGNKMSDF